MNDVFVMVNGYNFSPSWIMADKDEATVNATQIVWPDAMNLMCYFHVMKNIKQHFNGYENYADFVKFVRDIHFSLNEQDMVRKWNIFLDQYYHLTTTTFLKEKNSNMFFRNNS